jgi:plasmid segregation protein ParM
MHVEVKQVRVFPQPLGALLEYAVPRGYFTRVQNEVNLVIDPGMGTFDWFVSTGTVPIESRCGSFRNSVGAIVQAVATSLDPSLSENIRILQRIDDALRSKHPTVKFDGKECDLRKHIQIAENMARETVSAMLSSIGNTQDIDNIILAGGGATYFKEAAEQMLGRSIITSANPVVSNVLGFQLAAERIASELQQRGR